MSVAHPTRSRWPRRPDRFGALLGSPWEEQSVRADVAGGPGLGVQLLPPPPQPPVLLSGVLPTAGGRQGPHGGEGLYDGRRVLGGQVATVAPWALLARGTLSRHP